MILMQILLKIGLERKQGGNILELMSKHAIWQFFTVIN